MHPPSILCILITQWKEINWFHFLLEQLELASYFFFFCHLLDTHQLPWNILQLLLKVE